MTSHFRFLVVALGTLLSGCATHGNSSATHHAVTDSQPRQYELASRTADPLANYGAGTSAGIPDNPALGNWPGPITPPVSPLMAFGD